MVAIQLRRDGLSWHEIGGDIVVLDLVESVYLRLTGSGKAVWELLAEPRTEQDLEAALVERYGIETQRAATDVAAFISELRTRRLLVDVGDEDR